MGWMLNKEPIQTMHWTIKVAGIHSERFREMPVQIHHSASARLGPSEARKGLGGQMLLKGLRGRVLGRQSLLPGCLQEKNSVFIF